MSCDQVDLLLTNEKWNKLESCRSDSKNYLENQFIYGGMVLESNINIMHVIML